jgi:DNA phosphorothioation-associated putative methyltransferase
MKPENPPATIERHKAAIARTEMSKPVRTALEAGLFPPGTSFFDYGCGYGVDVRQMAELGYESSGWDPFYAPAMARQAADVVNLGYVINVIENEGERRETLRQAWLLARKILIVAAQVLLGEPGKGRVAYGDGVVSARNTFQKYYDQTELKNYIDSVLEADAVPVGLGIFFIFRDETQAQAFRAARFRSRTVVPRVKKQLPTFDDYRERLQPLMDFVSDRGRLPFPGELADEPAIRAEFRTLERAFALVKQATDAEEWDAITERRKEEMLGYMALSKFGRRPKITDLPADLQNDIKAFFGTYKNACETADRMLFSLGQSGVLAQACRTSLVGKLIGDTLYVHVSALETLPPLLKLYEGCASRTFGRLDHVTLIKFRADKPRVSYLFYPDFDTDPHPALHSSMKADLQSLYVEYRDYSNSQNPPVLHRKETFVTPDYPNFEKFARLTQQEEKWGLLEDPKTIGTRNGWRERLQAAGAELRGHRLVRSKQ